MATSYGFHPDALLEYAEAAHYYLEQASPQVAQAFVSEIENAVAAFVVTPTRWRVSDDPEIRRFILRRFPFVIYYRWETLPERVTIYAVMHTSREPGYWQKRLAQSS